MEKFRKKFEAWVWAMILVVLTYSFLLRDIYAFWEGIAVILIYLSWERGKDERNGG